MSAIERRDRRFRGHTGPGRQGGRRPCEPATGAATRAGHTAIYSARSARGRSLLCLGLAAALSGTLAGCAAQPYPSQPLSGEILYHLLVGGTEVSGVTLLRFYAWHVIGLGALAMALIAWHGFRVRRDGGISSPERPADGPAEPRTERAVSIRREALAMLLTVAAMVALSVLVEPPLGPPARLGALSESVKAPWIFLWVQELLRVWPPAIAGVAAPLVVLALLTLLPWLDWSNEGVAVWFNRQGRAAQILAVILFVAVLGLTIRAALH